MSAWLTAANKLRVARILGSKVETPTVRVIAFRDLLCRRAKPGQFIMLWIPGVDEIPLSILDVNDDGIVMVAVKRVGEATQALHEKRSGDAIGIRGPFGNSFTITRGKALLVGGGTGIAPLLFLAKKLKMEGVKPQFIAGAKTKDELLLINQLRDICGAENVLAATEDGSYGFKGLATQLMEKTLVNSSFDIIYACGPEPMLREAHNIAGRRNLPFEASLERIMRCAIGKYRVCRDGPVFNYEQLKSVEDFGRWKRDFDGKKIPIQ
ncbi:MAG: dihydroorotate dehydrogenase electron transfer subunit [Candidatus Bathyarchaeia archaeon]